MWRKPFAVLGTLVLVAGLAAAETAWSQPTESRLPKDFEFPKPIRPSDALEVVSSTTKEYLDRANAVALAKCTDRRVEYGSGGNIFTFYTFEVLDVVKGSQRRSVTMRLLGGKIGDTEIPLAFSPDFVVGLEYVLMLGPDNARGYATLNPAAVFIVKSEPVSGRKVVVPGASGMTSYAKSSGRRMVSSPDWSFLDDFVYSLKRATQ